MTGSVYKRTEPSYFSDAYERNKRLEVLSSPADEGTSMKNNFGSNSMRNRLKKLDLTPSHDKLETSPQITTPEARAMYEYVEYEDVDTGQRAEFERLLRKVSS